MSLSSLSGGCFPVKVVEVIHKVPVIVDDKHPHHISAASAATSQRRSNNHQRSYQNYHNVRGNKHRKIHSRDRYRKRKGEVTEY